MSEFYPLPRIITSINLGSVTVLGFDENHGYENGQIVSFRITKPYGTIELNNQYAKIETHTDTTITVAIQSSFYTPFIYPADTDDYYPQCIPTSSGILPESAVPQTNLQCSFDHRP